MSEHKSKLLSFNLLAAISKHKKVFINVVIAVNLLAILAILLIPKRFSSETDLTPPRYFMYKSVILLLDEIVPKDERFDIHLFKRLVMNLNSRVVQADFFKVQMATKGGKIKIIEDEIDSITAIKVKTPISNDSAEVIFTWSDPVEARQLLNEFIAFTSEKTRSSLKQDIDARIDVLQARAENMRFEEKLRNQNRIERVKNILAKQAQILSSNVNISFSSQNSRIPEEVLTRDFLVKELKQLNSRENFDAYIEELPEIMAEVNELQKSKESISSIDFFRTANLPSRGSRTMPSSPILLTIGVLFSLIFGVMAVILADELF